MTVAERQAALDRLGEALATPEPVNHSCPTEADWDALDAELAKTESPSIGGLRIVRS